jgi:hypothetical protein
MGHDIQPQYPWQRTDWSDILGLVAWVLEVVCSGTGKGYGPTRVAKLAGEPRELWHDTGVYPYRAQRVAR